MLSVHYEEANDLIDQYRAKMDFTTANLRYTPTTCFKIAFGDDQENNIDGYIRIPLLKSSMAGGKYKQIPDHSYAYVPILKTSLTNYSTSYPSTTYTDLYSLIQVSVFNSDNVANGKGIVISKNSMNGFSFILRQQYKFDSAMIASIAADTDNLCSLNSLAYRNCGVYLGPLKDGQIYTGPRDHVKSADLVLLRLQIKLQPLDHGHCHPFIFHLGHRYFCQ